MSEYKISGEDSFSNIIDETDGRGGVGRQGRGSGLGLSGRDRRSTVVTFKLSTGVTWVTLRSPHNPQYLPP